MTRYILAAAIVAIGFGSSSPVAAQSDANKEKARKLFQEGVKLFNRGQFEEACPMFEESLTLFAGVGTRGKLAECYERSGRTASAWRLYKEVAKLARQMNDAQRAKVAAKRAKTLEARLARLTIKPGPSFQLDGFKIERDKVEQPHRTYDLAVVVDPGSYRIRALAPGHEPWNGMVQLKEGESKVVEVPALVPDGLIPTEKTDSASPTGRRDGASTGRLAGIMLLGLGGLSLIGGTSYFGLTAYFANRESDGCEPTCSMEDEDANEKAMRNAALANVSAGVGVATIAAGAFLLWRARKRAAASRDERAWQLIPSVGSDSIGVALSGRL